MPEFVPTLQFENAVEVMEHEQVCNSLRLKVGYEFEASGDDDYYYGKKRRKSDDSAWDVKNEDLGFDPRFAYWFQVEYDCHVLCVEQLELGFFPFDVCTYVCVRVCVCVYLCLCCCTVV